MSLSVKYSQIEPPVHNRNKISMDYGYINKCRLSQSFYSVSVEVKFILYLKTIDVVLKYKLVKNLIMGVLGEISEILTLETA